MKLLLRMGAEVGLSEAEVLGEDSFVGFFQAMRSDAQRLNGLFADLDVGDELQERLQEAFAVCGDGRRPQGGRDAYFIVREPASVAADEVQVSGERWIAGMSSLASAAKNQPLAEKLSQIRRIRVLEGIAPKSPRQENEKTELLKAFETQIPQMVERIDGADPFAQALRVPYYYIGCDAMLRDYLMWPLYREHVVLADKSDQGMEPFAGYFALWRHGVKARIYREDQVDLYMPRIETTSYSEAE